MHYSSYAFSANGLPTIESLRGLSHLMGQSNGLSASDIRTLDWMYPPPVNVSVSYPNNVPTLSWGADPYATQYEVYLVRSQTTTDPWFGEQFAQYHILIGTTTGTSFNDPSHSYTGMPYCHSPSPWGTQEISEHYEVRAYTSYVHSGVRKGIGWAEISSC